MAAATEALGQVLSITTTTLAVGSFALNLILAASLNYLWGMINTLQLIAHVPLFKLQFPANAAFMYSFIVMISNFDILPTDILDDLMF